MGKLKVYYTPSGGTILCDWNIMPWVENIVKSFNKEEVYDGDTEIYVGSEIILDAFRVAVVEGLISHKDIIFIYGKDEIKIDHMGNLSDRPSGFMETHNNLLFRLI